jgi:hypothetical protein
MSVNFCSTNDKNNSQTERKILDVYYYLDFDDDTIDTNFLERYLQVNIIVNTKQYYCINRFVNCDNEYINTDKISNEDVIKRGLLIFNKMFRRLKLKGVNDIWFIYLSNGNIKNIYQDVFVTLINKNPCIKTCSYVINKNSINVKRNQDNSVKLERLQDVNKTLNELFVTNKTITYTNLVD